MTCLRVMRFLLLLIPIVAAARFPQRRSAPTASTPIYDSDYEAALVDDYESTTESPSFTYPTKSSSEEESTEEDYFTKMFGETTTVPDLADEDLNSATEVEPRNVSLSELFYENHPLEKYDIELCEARLIEGDIVQHYIFLDYHVYLSSMDSKNRAGGAVKAKIFTWQQAHDLCRSHCKELLTLDSGNKAYLMQHIIKQDGLLGIWTSGRRCDFPGCRDRKDVKEDEWFWSTSGEKIYTRSEPKSLDQEPYKWAMTGRAGPQPDNAEFTSRRVNESCLALRYDANTKELRLNDMSCHTKLNVVCEEPMELTVLRDDL